VNPLQFDDPADLARYPRDFAGDAALLEGAGAAMVFTGTVEGFFGRSELAEIPREDPGPAARGLEGAHRRGHFEGVATIVRRLFELVRPTRAFFGAKDFQQTLVVRHLAGRLGYPAIEVCPTVREADGLALSSRNARLDEDARRSALTLSRALFQARAAWVEGVRDADALRELLAAELDVPGVQVEYADVRDPARFDEPASGRMEHARALVAAVVGGVRLIDNLALDPLDEA
jgi:pantoate--beta-alanine ligase